MVPSSAKKPSPSSKSGSAKKQGTLFSFFAKKKPAKPPSSNDAAAISKNKSILDQSTKSASASLTAATTSNGTTVTSASKNNKKITQSTQSKPSSQTKQEKLLSQVKVGTSLSVYWPNDNKFYNAKVTSKCQGEGGDDGGSNVYTLIYEDGDVETIDLTNEDFKILSYSISVTQSQQVLNEEDDDDDDDDDGPLIPSKTAKRRRIAEESEDEGIFDDEISEDGGSDDASEFIAMDEEEDDDDDFEEDDDDEDEDQDIMMNVTDEDDEEALGGRSHKSGKKRLLKMTQSKSDHQTSNKKMKSAHKDKAPFITPPPKHKRKSNQSSSSAVVKSISLASFASGSKSASTKDGKETQTQGIRKISPFPDLSSNLTPTSNKSSSVKIPLPQVGVVNQAGTHYHNHYTFLQPSKICDGKNRPMSHPDYDPRTLKVNYREIERVSGKLTPAAQQWWDIKSNYADTLLLFKTGKFYEIYQMDADAAVSVLGFNYMKGPIAHAGFPEIGYGKFCEKLVKAGYKVARVEQTETPDMLKERKKKIKVGKKPSVVNREVCSIVSSGTRTFCYMDDISSLENTSINNDVGPLLAIKEVLVDSNTSSDDTDDSDIDNVKPVCEYGITIIDAATGVISIGQFADDILRSRMNTLLTNYSPSEILVENGTNGASETLLSCIKSAKSSFLPMCKVEKVNSMESSPKSTAVDPSIRKQMQRPKSDVQPWNKLETLEELHRRNYFPRASKKLEIDTSDVASGISRWPSVLKACIEGGADLAMSSFGAVLFYLQRSLIDQDILSMGIIKAYVPPDPANSCVENDNVDSSLRELVTQEQQKEDGINIESTSVPKSASAPINFAAVEHSAAEEASINYLSLDGTTIANLEILANSHSNTVAGSLWSKINYTKSPFGSRLLRAWLLRPLFRKNEIDRRADAVEELISGGAAASMVEARCALAKCGDLERLLSRVHSMGTADGTGHHPNARAILYEEVTHTKRKVEDFSKLLNGLRAISRIPEMFEGVEIKSDMLNKIVRTRDDDGLFPSNLDKEIDWFFDNFDCRKASQGHFEPARGMDEDYDAACDEIERIKRELEDYKQEMCTNVLRPKHVARSQWKYANTKVDSKDKYLIELPIGVEVPRDFIVKGKRGKGDKQVNKYRTPVVEQLVDELELAFDVMKSGKARGIQLVFAKFDSMRSLWSSAAQASAMLDALGALAQASTAAGFSRPIIMDCPPDSSPFINVKQGRHPCVAFTHSGDDFIPNDLSLGGNKNKTDIEDLENSDTSRILLLSGPNMGGKSTLLRQTCLVAILAQIGCFVPAEECSLTPFDRIFTRLGASDRILLGQSTFFVELAETAAALRGATRRSLVIMDELGRGTSTFDGTAIASATVKHLVEKNQCLTLFATHYHSLLEDWKDQPTVRLGHMECYVEGSNEKDDQSDENDDTKITFLYTLGEGSCPRSFGINVARLAGLPDEVLQKAKNISTSFEETLNGGSKPGNVVLTRSEINSLQARLVTAAKEENWEELESIWQRLQCEK